MDSQPSKQALSIPRIPQACERCRIKRIRCSGDQPCERCQQQGSECSFGYPRGYRRRSILDEHSRTYSADQSPGASMATSSLTSSRASRSKSQSKSTSSTSRSSGPQSQTPAISVEDEDKQENELSLDDYTDSSLASPVDATFKELKRRPKRTTARPQRRTTRISSACLECKKRRRKVGHHPGIS